MVERDFCQARFDKYDEIISKSVRGFNKDQMDIKHKIVNLLIFSPYSIILLNANKLTN